MRFPVSFKKALSQGFSAKNAVNSPFFIFAFSGNL